jgi:small-conductance mechanosensitive channel
VAVGVGFGLQNIISNFISGLIIMLDRALRVGDRVEVAGVEGEVVQIGARRTTVVTDDRIAILVPNQRFVTDNVTNRTYYDDPIRLRLPVVVQHGPDARVVQRIILERAVAHPDVLADPAPEVRLLSLAGNMQFELQVWNRSHLQRRDALISALNLSVLEALRAHDIKPA